MEFMLVDLRDCSVEPAKTIECAKKTKTPTSNFADTAAVNTTSVFQESPSTWQSLVKGWVKSSLRRPCILCGTLSDISGYFGCCIVFAVDWVP